MRLVSVLALLLLALPALAVPSLVENASDGVVLVRDDGGEWGGMTTGITHQNLSAYQAKKVLDLSDVPAAVWDRVVAVRLSLYFMVRDYSWHDLPKANGLDESYEVVVNGTTHLFADNSGAPVMQEGKFGGMDWYDIDVPRAELKRGVNEIIVRKAPGEKGDDYLYLGIDNTRKRGNSAVTFDGNAWTQDKLTIPGGNGEYMIRLYLITRPLRFETAWRPGVRPELSDPTRVVLYAGARGAKSGPAGLRLTAGQTARLEWAPGSVDGLEPLEVRVEGEGGLQLTWLDREGQPVKTPAPASSPTAVLPGSRTFIPSGLLLAPTTEAATLRSVTLTGARSYHPLPRRINLAPTVKALAPFYPALTPSCKLSAKGITLQTGTLRARFETGGHLRLVSLDNLIVKSEMVRSAAANYLFLVEADGKRYAGSRDFRLVGVKAIQNGFSAELALEQPALRATLRVWAAKDGLRFAMELANTGAGSLDFKLAFPYLGGLAVSPKPADDYYYFPAGGGIIADTPAVIRRGYGDHQALYQLLDLYSPALGGGVYLRADDSEGWHKVVALRKCVGNVGEANDQGLSTPVAPEYLWNNPLDAVEGTSFTYEYLRRTRAPGGSFIPAAAVLQAHSGDWHTALGDYADWAHRVWKFRAYPSRLKNVRNMIAAGWGQSVLLKDGKYRTDFIYPDTNCIELMSWWDWSPLGPYMTPFDQLDKRLTAAEIKEWEGYFVKDPVTGQKMWNNQPGDYAGYNERFGGLPAFQQAVKAYQGMGALTTLYTDPFRLDENCPTGRLHGREWTVILPDGKPSTGYDVYNPCHYLREVRQWVATTMGRVMRETGADGIRLDEYGHRGWACHSKDHKHDFAEPGITQWNKAIADTCRLVHEEMDKVKPGLVLTTEHPGYDYLMQYLDGCITYDLTVQASPLRPLECNTARFYFPECKAYELDHRGADPGDRKKFWNAVESFGRYYPIPMYNILNENEEVYQGRNNFALSPTLQPYVYCNRFAGGGKTLYHLYNATGHTFEGPVLAPEIAKGAAVHVIELLTAAEVTPVSGKVSLYLERDGVACLAVLPKLLDVARKEKQLAVTLKSAAPGTRLAVCDRNGKELLAQEAKTGPQTLDLAGLPADASPALLKLLAPGSPRPQLLDAAAL